MPDIIGIAPSNLLVDEINPRLLQPNEGQREAMRALAKTMPRKILVLAKDIVEFGTDPGNLPYVVSAGDKENRYIVVEGNRRVVALKALENPDSFVGALDNSSLEQMRALAREYQKQPIDNVHCVLFKNRKDIEHWIDLRHTGENGGAGIVSWGGDESNRFRARSGLNVDLSTQALDLLQSMGMLSNEERERVPASNFTRLLGDPYFRSKVALGVEKKELTILGPIENVAKALRHVALDLADPNGTRVKTIYTKKARKQYADRLPKSAVVKVTKKNGTKASEVTKKKVAKPKRKPKFTRPRKRDNLIPTDCVLQGTKGRIREIEAELRSLSIETYTNAVAIMLRVFVELSMDQYVTDNKLPVKETSSLGHKMTEVAKHLVLQAKFTDKQMKIVTKAAQKGQYLGPSLDLMHDFIHHTEVFPAPSDLRAHWDSLQPFMTAAWSK